MQISQSISTAPSGPDFLLHIVWRENPLGVQPLVVSKHQIRHLYWFKTWTEFWPCHLTGCRFRSKLLNVAMLSFHLTLTGLSWGLNEVLPALCLGQCLGHGSSGYFLFRFIQGTYTDTFWVFVGTLIARSETLPLDSEIFSWRFLYVMNVFDRPHPCFLFLGVVSEALGVLLPRFLIFFSFLSSPQPPTPPPHPGSLPLQGTSCFFQLCSAENKQTLAG